VSAVTRRDRREGQGGQGIFKKKRLTGTSVGRERQNKGEKKMAKKAKSDEAKGGKE